MWDACFICIPLFRGLAQLRPFFSCNQWQTCSGLVYNYQDVSTNVSAHMYVIEHWVRAKVVRFSIAGLEISLLYMPHTFDSFYALPHQKYRPSSFSTEQPLHQNFTFTGNHATELKQGNPERTSVNTDIRSWKMADIWSEKNVGFIGPAKFLSDLTVGPTYFAKSGVNKWGGEGLERGMWGGRRGEEGRRGGKTRGPGALCRAQEYHCNLALKYLKENK